VQEAAQEGARLYFGRFIDACEAVYESPQIQAGPDGRDGASLIGHPDCRILAFAGTKTSGSALMIACLPCLPGIIGIVAWKCDRLPGLKRLAV